MDRQLPALEFLPPLPREAVKKSAVMIPAHQRLCSGSGERAPRARTTVVERVLLRTLGLRRQFFHSFNTAFLAAGGPRLFLRPL
jgi:hypothetical protein